jgi:lysophospholipase L1-like esterase
VFAVGINDTQYVHGRPLTTPAAVCTTVRSRLLQARAYAPRLCWVGLTPVDEARTTPIPWMQERSYRHAVVAEVNAAIQRTVTDAAVPYLDLFSVWTANGAYPQLLDGIHPNAAGHAQLCAQVTAFLQRQGLDP